jgi:AAA15 family ATPase/GTPase
VVNNEQDGVLLSGFGFSNYRSYGEDYLAKIAPLRKINFIIGKNNAGKSNIINFLSEHYPGIAEISGLCATRRGSGVGEISNLKSIDFPLSLEESNRESIAKIAFFLPEKGLNRHVSLKFSSSNSNSLQDTKAIEYATKILRHASLYDEHKKGTWFTYKLDRQGETPRLSIEFNPELFKNMLTLEEWRILWESLHPPFQVYPEDNAIINRSIEKLFYPPNEQYSLPPIAVIKAIRKVENGDINALNFSGPGIIDRLDVLQNPGHENYQNCKDKFDSINEFLKEVLDSPNARIEIPHHKETILVHIDNKPLPLESLGTGIQEVIILATAATILEKTIVCVEEPELHLHPLLQKKLIQYISKHTSNQYLFSTHSAHLLDSVEEAQIFHVTYSDGQSKVESISSTKEKSRVCNDLGYHASDILQSNCIIWVEGPSDRIYINYWIQAKRPDLKEGLHYSIMFYGGRLFSHLTALDSDESKAEINDFISLKSLNRNVAIVFDSDKSKPESSMTGTKIRLEEEFSREGFAWVTAGREIENYLDYERLEKVILAVHPRTVEKINNKSQWSNLLQCQRKESKGGKSSTVEADKVKVASGYIKGNEKPNFTKLDLDEKVGELIRFILKSNPQLHSDLNV